MAAQSQPSCPFCAIVRRAAPATITYQDDLVVAFKDIAPMAPFHELVIPRRHIDSLAATTDSDGELLGRTGRSDTIDAIVAVTAERAGKRVRLLTGDAEDLRALTDAMPGVAVVAI